MLHGSQNGTYNPLSIKFAVWSCIHTVCCISLCDAFSNCIALGFGLLANLAAAVTLSWASDVTPDDGFIFVAIHPGSVSTDMTTAAFR